jgi:hypothetical protein
MPTSLLTTHILIKHKGNQHFLFLYEKQLELFERIEEEKEAGLDREQAFLNFGNKLFLEKAFNQNFNHNLIKKRRFIPRRSFG